MQELIDSLLGSRGSLHQRGNPAYTGKWPSEHIDINDKFGNVSDGNFTLDGLDSANINGDYGAQTNQQNDGWHEESVNFNLS